MRVSSCEEQLELMAEGTETIKAKAKEVRTKKPAPSADTRGTASDAEKKYDRIVKRILQSYETLPDDYRKWVVRGIAGKSPVMEWLQAPEEETANETTPGEAVRTAALN